jgi:hypothetical protein
MRATLVPLSESRQAQRLPSRSGSTCAFIFAEIAAKLIQTVAIGGYAAGCEYGVVDVFGSPAILYNAGMFGHWPQQSHKTRSYLDMARPRMSQGNRHPQVEFLNDVFAVG